jgi:septal ring factor EnvC (AmiA/AmiB activator)
MEAKQLLAEMEAEEATLAAERAIQSKNEAQAAEAAIKAQARYEAEATVRELEAQLWEKDSIIHALQAETEKLKHKLSTLREFLQEKNMFENFLSWFRGRNQQQSLDDRER